MIADLWLQRLQEVYLFQRGTRMNELRGKYVKFTDDRGLHPESLLWGSIFALQDLDPALGELGADPVEFRTEARREAEQIFRDEILEAAAA